ncbi:MAG: flippase-like domain-containing protein [Bacteroidetes bacterium]|nr:flippase-like domain-containing protein [Bacteroidota bacterium]
MQKNTKKLLNIFFVLIVISLTIYGLFANLDLDSFVDSFSGINWIYCALSVPVALLSHLVRALRWRLYVNPIKKDVSLFNLFSAVMVGYAVNNWTPRGGELVRPYVLARRVNCSKSSLIATIIVERLIDVFFLLLMFCLVFLLSKELILQAFPWLNTNTLTLMGGLVFLVVLCLFLLLTTNIFDNLLNKILRKLSAKWTERIYNIWRAFKLGFETLKTPRDYLYNFLYSCLIWLLYTIPSYLMFFAFDFQNTAHLTIIDAGLLVVVSGIGMSIAPVPGGIGVYHWIAVTCIVNLYPQISTEEALAYATVSHGINLLIQVLAGGLFMLRENIRNVDLKE